MNKIILTLVLFSAIIFGQFKEQNTNPNIIKDGIIDNNSGTSLFGFFNPNSFFMKHSYSMSYSSFGNYGIAMGVYTNSMMYKFADNLNIQVDASLMHTPYNNFGNNFSEQFNGIYLSKAQLNYQPWKDVQLSVSYRSFPANSFNPYFYQNSGMFNHFENRNSFFGQ